MNSRVPTTQLLASSFANTSKSGNFVRSKRKLAYYVWEGWITVSTPWSQNISGTVVTSDGYFITYKLNDTATIWRSLYGTAGSWTQFNTPNVFHSIYVNNNTIIAINRSAGINAVYRSTNNGETWTTYTMPFDQEWGNLFYANNMWVCVPAASGTKVAYSLDDGITWSLGDDIESHSNGYTITYCNNFFYIAPHLSTTKQCLYSSNCFNWKQMENLNYSGYYSSTYKIVSNSKILMRGPNYYSANNYDISFDGKVWNYFALNHQIDNYSIDITNNNIFILKKYSFNPAKFSFDGINWYNFFINIEDAVPVKNPVTGRYFIPNSWMSGQYTDSDPQPVFETIIE